MIKIEQVGHSAEGHLVRSAELRSDSHRAVVLSYGGVLHHFSGPDGFNIVRGLPALRDYERDGSYHGALIGRVANRIKPARFEIDEQRYALPKNEPDTCLHGGPDGFNRQIWDMHVESDTLSLRHVSPDGHMGFPGRLTCRAQISLRASVLRLELSAETTATTVVNLTWHPYFNLSGTDSIDNHILNGKRVGGAKVDSSVAIPGTGLRPIAKVEAAKRTLFVRSDYPECQIYTGDTLTPARSGLALEPQYAPNDIHNTRATLLHPCEIYRHVIEYEITT